jgi:hypothetical protein
MSPEYFSDEISAAQITTDDDNLSIIGNVDDMEWMDTEEVTSHEGGDGDIDDADREWGNSMDDLFSYIDDDLLIGADINYWSDVDISEEDSDDNGILTPDFSSHSETE